MRHVIDKRCIGIVKQNGLKSNAPYAAQASALPEK